MKKTGIITDSNSGILPEEAARIGVLVVPMPFECGEESFLEGENLTREDFFRKMRQGEFFLTAQPSPESVMNIWKKGLETYEEIVYIPMSSGLSGSCNTAKMLAEEPEFQGKVFVVDNGMVATPMHRSVLEALELAEEGFDAAAIRRKLEIAKKDMVIYVAVETLEHLKRGGRISSTSAVVGSLLNIKPVLKFDIGVLETHSKCRGMKKARHEMLLAMKNDLETRFASAYARKEVCLMAASSASEEEKQNWIKEIEDFFPGMRVMYDDLPLSLCCHIGEGGLGIGCSVRVPR